MIPNYKTSCTKLLLAFEDVNNSDAQDLRIGKWARCIFCKEYQRFKSYPIFPITDEVACTNCDLYFTYELHPNNSVPSLKKIKYKKYTIYKFNSGIKCNICPFSLNGAINLQREPKFNLQHILNKVNLLI